MNLTHKTKKQLYELARQYQVPNPEKMDKTMLINALMQLIFRGSRLPATSSMAFVKTRHGDGQKGPVLMSPLNVPTAPTDKKEASYPIPSVYERDFLILMPINPSHIYACWELSRQTRETLQVQYGINAPQIILQLCVMDQNETRHLERVQVAPVSSYLFHHYLPSTMCWVEMGVSDEKGSYFSIMESRRVKMPNDTMDDIQSIRIMTVRKNEKGQLILSDQARLNAPKHQVKTVWDSISSIESIRRPK